MAECEICGNEGDMPLEVTIQGEVHVFDSLECAIHALSPTCVHCGCKIIGHLADDVGTLYLCAHCAQKVDGGGLYEELLPWTR